MISRFAILFALLAFAFGANAKPIRIDIEPADCPLLQGKIECLHAVTFKGSSIWLGGISGLAASEDGATLWLLSDRAFLVKAKMKDGLQFEDADIVPLKDEQGKWPSFGQRDSESLLRQKDGSFFIGFERRHRVWHYASADAVPQPIAPADLSLKALHYNGGLESIAQLKDGRQVLLAEEDPQDQGRIPGWVIENGKAFSFSYHQHGDFLPTDMALLPGGDLLVLERAYDLFPLRFEAQLVRIKASSLKPGAEIEAARIASLQETDNLEGLAAFHGKDGSTLLYIASDNNYTPRKESRLLLLRLPK